MNCITIKIGNKEITPEFIIKDDKNVDYTDGNQLPSSIIFTDLNQGDLDILTKVIAPIRTYKLSEIDELRSSFDEDNKKVFDSLVSALRLENANVTVTKMPNQGFTSRIQYYNDTIGGKVVPVRGIQISNEMDEVRLLHELTHALLDQYVSNGEFNNLISLLREEDAFKDAVKTYANDNYDNLMSKDIGEFFSILFGNSSYIKRIANTEFAATDNKTLLTYIVDFINEKHGIGKTTVRKSVQTAKSKTVADEENDGELLDANLAYLGANFSTEGGDSVFIPNQPIADEAEFIAEEKTFLNRVEEIAKRFLENVYYRFSGGLSAPSLDKLIEQQQEGQVSKMFNIMYNMPIYRDGTDLQNIITQEEGRFNHTIDGLKEQDIVKIPFLNWDGKKWYVEEKNKGKFIWMPVMYTIPGAGLIKLAKPYKTTTSKPYMTIPYWFIQGVRTNAGTLSNSRINNDTPKEINDEFGYNPKNKNHKGNKNYVVYENGGISPNFKNFNVLSARLYTEDQELREVTVDQSKEGTFTAESDKVFFKAKPNAELVQTLRKGDLVKVKMKNDKGKTWYLWKPVRNVSANAVEIVVGGNVKGVNGSTVDSLFYVDMDDVLQVAINKNRPSENKYINTELSKKEVTTKKGTFEVDTLDSKDGWIKKYIGGYNDLKKMNEFRKKHGLKPLTVGELKEAKKNMLSTIKVGDYIQGKITINGKPASSGLKKVVAVSPTIVYVAAKGNTDTSKVEIFPVKLDTVEEIHKNLKEDLGELKKLNEAFELQKQGDWKNPKNINNAYVFENVDAEEEYKIGRLNKGDIIKHDVGGKIVHSVVSSVDGESVNTVTTFGKEINIENISIQKVPFKDIVEVGYKTNTTQKRLMAEVKRFRRNVTADHIVFKSKESAKRYVDAANKFKPNSVEVKEVDGKLTLHKIYGNKGSHPVWGLNRNFHLVPKNYTYDQLKGIKRGSKRLKKGDAIKTFSSKYYSEVQSVIFNKKGIAIGVKVKGASDEKAWVSTVMFYDKDGKEQIERLGYPKWLYEERTKELYSKLDIKLKESLRSQNIVKRFSKNSYVKSKKSDISLLKELAKRLTKLNPNIELRLVTNKEMSEMGYNGVRGFTDGSKVYINTDLASNSDMIHEYGHILINILKVENPDLYQSIVQRSLDSPLYNHFKTLYPNLSEESLGEEIFLSALDNNAKNKIFPPKTKTWWDSIEEFVNQFFKFVKARFKNLFNIPEEKLELFDKLTYYDFMKADLNSLVDVFGDKILNSKIQPSVNNSMSKNIVSLGIDTFYMNVEQVKRLKEVMNSRIC